MIRVLNALYTYVDIGQTHTRRVLLAYTPYIYDMQCALAIYDYLCDVLVEIISTKKKKRLS